jgi:hypothetical protein
LYSNLQQEDEAEFVNMKIEVMKIKVAGDRQKMRVFEIDRRIEKAEMQYAASRFNFLDREDVLVKKWKQER